MFCLKCEYQVQDGENFCRKCGADLENASLAPRKRSLRKGSVTRGFLEVTKDPDELTSNGIGSMFVGDGFFMVAVILSASHTSISSFLWLLLLIPAFFFFGKGFADLLYARQIRARLKQNQLGATANGELPPSHVSVVDVFNHYRSGNLINSSSMTERTTQQLK